MRDFNRRNVSRGGRQGRGNFRRRDSGPRQMHKAVCDECGNNCEVPFKPSGGKPIYCSACFEKKEGGSSRRPGRRDAERSYGRKDNTNKQLLEQVSAVNTKLDKILQVLESGAKKKPASKKAVVKKPGKKIPKKTKEEPVKKAVKKADPKTKNEPEKEVLVPSKS